jgi:hypothetical protein
MNTYTKSRNNGLEVDVFKVWFFNLSLQLWIGFCGDHVEKDRAEHKRLGDHRDVTWCDGGAVRPYRDQSWGFRAAREEAQ